MPRGPRTIEKCRGALRLLNLSGYKKRVRNLAVSTYNLMPSTSGQLGLFAPYPEAMDKINARWGEFVMTPALMMEMGDIIFDRISFGGVKELKRFPVYGGRQSAVV